MTKKAITDKARASLLSTRPHTCVVSDSRTPRPPTPGNLRIYRSQARPAAMRAGLSRARDQALPSVRQLFWLSSGYSALLPISLAHHAATISQLAALFLSPQKKEPQCQGLRLSRSSIQGEVQTREIVTRRGEAATINSDMLTVKTPPTRLNRWPAGF